MDILPCSTFLISSFDAPLERASIIIHRKADLPIFQISYLFIFYHIRPININTLSVFLLHL